MKALRLASLAPRSPRSEDGSKFVAQCNDKKKPSASAADGNWLGGASLVGMFVALVLSLRLAFVVVFIFVLILVFAFAVVVVFIHVLVLILMCGLLGFGVLNAPLSVWVGPSFGMFQACGRRSLDSATRASAGSSGTAVGALGQSTARHADSNDDCGKQRDYASHEAYSFEHKFRSMTIGANVMPKERPNRINDLRWTQAI